MQRKHNGISTKTMAKAANRESSKKHNKNLKKTGSDSVDDGEDITLPAAWVSYTNNHCNITL